MALLMAPQLAGKRYDICRKSRAPRRIFVYFRDSCLCISKILPVREPLTIIQLELQATRTSWRRCAFLGALALCFVIVYLFRLCKIVPY